MDFGDLFKAMGNPREMAKAELSAKMDAYFERLYKITSIARNPYEMDKESGAEFLEKQSLVIELLTDQANAAAIEFQKEHGEI